MNSETRIVKDVPAAFAALVRDECAARTTDLYSIAFSGGSIATPCYEQLAKQDVDWGSIVAIWGDERCVPLDHEDSNFVLARRALLDNVSPLADVHPMDCDQGAEAYDDIVRSLSPVDLIHLGMGDDGHTASLFPGCTSALEESSRLVIETGDDHHKHRRLTLTYPAINQARLVVFTVSGESKREMFARVQGGEDLPASRVDAARVVWLVDDAAAGSTLRR